MNTGSVEFLARDRAGVQEPVARRADEVEARHEREREAGPVPEPIDVEAVAPQQSRPRREGDAAQGVVLHAPKAPRRVTDDDRGGHRARGGGPRRAEPCEEGADQGSQVITSHDFGSNHDRLTRRPAPVLVTSARRGSRLAFAVVRQKAHRRRRAVSTCARASRALRALRRFRAGVPTRGHAMGRGKKKKPRGRPRPRGRSGPDLVRGGCPRR